MGCRGMGVWGATPEPQQYLLALCITITPILRTQKQFCCTVGYSGMDVRGATPEAKQHFFAFFCISNTATFAAL